MQDGMPTTTNTHDAPQHVQASAEGQQQHTRMMPSRVGHKGRYWSLLLFEISCCMIHPASR
jgi:hypothetical protein